MNKTLVAAIVRHTLSVLSGVAISQGYLSSEEWTSAIGGAAALFSVIWSVAQKRKVAQ